METHDLLSPKRGMKNLLMAIVSEHIMENRALQSGQDYVIYRLNYLKEAFLVLLHGLL